LQLGGLRTSKRQQLEAVGGGQFRERALWIAGGLEVSVERAVFEFLCALLLFQVFGPDVLL
jgi:hypothetical protein